MIYACQNIFQYMLLQCLIYEDDIFIGKSWRQKGICKKRGGEEAGGGGREEGALVEVNQRPWPNQLVLWLLYLSIRIRSIYPDSSYLSTPSYLPIRAVYLSIYVVCIYLCLVSVLVLPWFEEIAQLWTERCSRQCDIHL